MLYVVDKTNGQSLEMKAQAGDQGENSHLFDVMQQSIAVIDRDQLKTSKDDFFEFVNDGFLKNFAHAIKEA